MADNGITFRSIVRNSRVLNEDDLAPLPGEFEPFLIANCFVCGIP